MSLKEDAVKAIVITNTLVQHPSIDFLGRENKIADIEKYIENGKKLVLVNGIGGIGKTQICSYLYYKYLDKTVGEIRYLGWLTYEGDLRRSMFHHFQDITGIEDSNDYFNKSIEYLNHFGNKLLLFLDNANAITFEEQKILSSLACIVIVTSRNKDFDNLFHKIKIEQLSKEDCLILYKRNAYGNDNKELNIEELDAVIEIIHRVDRHSLTLILLAKTQKETHTTAKKLLEQVIHSNFNLSDIKEPIRNADVETSFIEHLRALFRVVELNQEERKLLKWFSLMPNLHLPYDKVKQWFELESFTQVNGLVKKGWLMDNAEDDAVLVHPIIAAVVRVELGIDVEECEVVIRNIKEEISYSSYDNYAEKWKSFSFAYALAKCFEKNDYENIILGDLYLRIGITFRDQGDYQKALAYDKKALNIRETVLGRKHPDTATTYHNIALVFQAQGDYEKALTYYEKALHIMEKVLGREHPDTATTYNNMAGVFYDQGDYEKALTYYEKALIIRKKVLGAEHPYTIATYNMIAQLTALI